MAASETIKFSGKGQAGDLLDPNNWVGGVVPGIDDTALITINIGGPAEGTFGVNNLMLLGAESITFAGTLNTAGVGACQGLMICDGATATFAPGAVLNDGNVVIVGNEAAGAMVVQGSGGTHAVVTTVDANIGKQNDGVGTVTIDDGVWNNSAHAFIGDFGSGALNVIDNGSVSFGGWVEMANAAGSKGVLTIASGGSVTVAGGLLLGGAGLSAFGAASIRNVFGSASVSVGAGSSLTVDHGIGVGTGSELDIAGGSVTGGATADCIGTRAGGVIAGYGDLTTRAGAWIYDDGVIRASGGSLEVDGNVNGEGSIQIAANSAAMLTGGHLTLSSIAFIGADATLGLAQGAKVTAAIAGFALGDVIEMAKVDAVSFNQTTGILILSDAGKTVDQLHLTGNFAGDTFAVSQTATGAMIALQHG